METAAQAEAPRRGRSWVGAAGKPAAPPRALCPSGPFPDYIKTSQGEVGTPVSLGQSHILPSEGRARGHTMEDVLEPEAKGHLLMLIPPLFKARSSCSL